MSCLHSLPSPDSKVELLTPSHCQLDGHALKVRLQVAPTSTPLMRCIGASFRPQDAVAPAR